MRKFENIAWSRQSATDLEDILEHYLIFAPGVAHKRVQQIIDAVDELLYSEQWQTDEIDPACRRIIVEGKFKVLYTLVDRTILITRVYPTKKRR